MKDKGRQDGIWGIELAQVGTRAWLRGKMGSITSVSIITFNGEADETQDGVKQGFYLQAGDVD